MATLPVNGKSYKRLPVLHPVRSAHAAGLRYVSDAAPGLVREGVPGAFRYRHPQGTLVRDAATLGRNPPSDVSRGRELLLQLVPAPSITPHAPPIPLTRIADAEIQPGTYRGVAPPAAVGRVGQARAQSNARSTASLAPPPKESDESSPASRSSVFPNGSDDLQTALSDLAVAEDGDAVVESLIVGLAGLAKEVVVFAVRGASFRSRGRTDLLSRPRRDATVELPPGENSLTQCLELGQYLGPLDDGSPELLFLEEHYDEVCVTRVDVMNRPALVVFVAGFSSPYDVSLRSDHLARAASDALARLVISRKR